MRRRCAFLLALGVAVAAQAQPPAELFAYLARTKGTAAWEVVGTEPVGLGRVIEIRLRSQVWRGIPWTHRLSVYEPGAVLVEDVVIVYISGDPSRSEALLGTTVASYAGLRVAVLSGVPNQPLFGLREDALVAHTFQRYLAEGEPDWPLLFPMTRSVHAAMEALEALAPELWGVRLRGFVVTGASKRGWTTYLTGATAPERVLGIAPIVYDFLNIPLQLAHQVECFGSPSDRLRDYTARGLTGVFGADPAAARLAWLVDPYSYRYALTMPKLLIVGSNDPYWATDATSLYWPGLPDPKLLLVVPNGGHELLDFGRVVSSLVAFARLVARGRDLPRLEASLRFSVDGAVLRVSANWEPVEARLWVAESPTRDFRAVRWGEGELARAGNSWEARVAGAASGYRAFFAELVFLVDGLRLHVSTPTRVLGP